MSMWHKVKWIFGLVGGGIVALWLYLTAHRHGRAKGRKEVLGEHVVIIKKVEEKEAQKHAISSATVVDDLNRLTGGGKPK